MTNEEINALSDPQINLMMALNDESHQWTMDPNNKERHIGQEKDYCNDPAVMMQIAFDNNISIMKHKDYLLFTAFVVGEIDDAEHDLWLMVDYRTDDAKPCRAAAIVYLKMKGVL